MPSVVPEHRRPRCTGLIDERVVSAVDYAAAIQGLGPLAYYRLDEASGSFLDSSGGAYTASPTGSITYNQTGALLTSSNTAATFAGGYATTALSAALVRLKADSSISCFVKFTTTTFSCICTRRDGTNPHILVSVNRSGANGKIGCESWMWSNAGTRCESPSAYNDGNWHFVVATYTQSDDTLRLYVDNSLVDSKLQSSTTPSSSSMAIYIANNSGSQALPGTVDELAVFNKALTSGEIAMLYAASGR